MVHTLHSIEVKISIPIYGKEIFKYIFQKNPYKVIASKRARLSRASIDNKTSKLSNDTL